MLSSHQDHRLGLESEGILRLLRERITNRVTAQLDPSARAYSTMDAVIRGCRTVANKIKKDQFKPDMIVAWSDPERTYQGSETVARILAQDLNAPLRVIHMRETGERREVIQDCQWVAGLQKLLLVDDACYSGTTLKVLAAKCREVEASADIRFAVLTTLDAKTLPNLNYATIHHTEELLFPWGWSRLIVSFYDVYSMFGILDRRFVVQEPTAWGTATTVANDFSGTVCMLTIDAGMSFHQEPSRDRDVFLYFVGGKAEISIGTKVGSFGSGEYLFIPREISYAVRAIETVKLLQLLSRAR